MEVEVAILFAMQNGYFDDVPVSKVSRIARRKLQEFMTTREGRSLLGDIRDKKVLEDGMNVDSLKQAHRRF